ncbi:MAG: lamin tail domain-containing protein, partial [Pseudomonadota bacterium]
DSGTEIDRVEYDGGPLFPNPNGASMSLADPATDNNVSSNWCEAITAFGDGDLGTPGAANDCVITVLPELVINEIMQNPAAVGDGSGEYIELFNPTGTPVDIEGWTLRDDGTNSHVINNGGPLIVPANGYLVLGINGDTGTNGGVPVDYVYTSIALANGVDEVILDDGSGNEIDRVEYDDGATFPDPAGASMSLTDPTTDNNVGINWCEASTAFGDGDFGTPGAANDCPGFQIPSLVINEVDYDQDGTDNAEFIELFNAGASAVDLTGLAIELVNGNTNSVYESFNLPAVSLAAGDWFVLCANPANTPNCDLDVSPDTNLIQNGEPEAVALVQGALVIDTVSYEGSVAAPYVEGTGTTAADNNDDFFGLARFPDGADSNDNNADFAGRCITPGEANVSDSTACSNPFPTVIAEIFDIQGAGLASPLAGQNVITNDNIVTAVGPNLFVMQTPDARADADPDTANGIVVFVGGPPTVSVGDQVDVTGDVDEFFGLTEITSVTSINIDSSGNPLPAAVVLDGATPSPNAPPDPIEFERVEGMRVTLASGIVCSGNQGFGSDPLAEVYITAGPNRCFREPGIESPGLPGLPIWDGNPEVFELDPDALGLANATLRGGASFNAEGVIAFEFGDYELWPTSFTITDDPPFEPVRSRDPGEFTIGSLNLFRLFDDIDDPVDPDGRNDVVIPTAEYERRLIKFARYIVDVLDAPDVLGVQEVESLVVMQDLAAAINAFDASVNYSAFLVEGNDIGTIDVGFLTRDRISVDSTTQLGADETLTVDGSPLHDRPPFLLEGAFNDNGAPFPFAVMVNHNRSLGGIDDASSGPRVRQKRLEQAQSIAEKVQAFQTTNPDVPLMVIGDLNAFEFSDGYVDVVGQIAGDFNPGDNLLSGPDLVDPNLVIDVLGLPTTERYSFIFNGNAQTLDHAL